MSVGRQGRDGCNDPHTGRRGSWQRDGWRARARTRTRHCAIESQSVSCLGREHTRASSLYVMEALAALPARVASDLT